MSIHFVCRLAHDTSDRLGFTIVRVDGKPFRLYFDDFGAPQVMPEISTPAAVKSATTLAKVVEGYAVSYLYPEPMALITLRALVREAFMRKETRDRYAEAC